jgi:hypothetical protein
LVFKHQRLGDLIWKLSHPRDAVLLQSVERACTIGI